MPGAFEVSPANNPAVSPPLRDLPLPPSRPGIEQKREKPIFGLPLAPGRELPDPVVQITPRSTVNVFDWTVAAASANRPCIFGAGLISGIACYDEASRKLRGLAPYAGRNDLYFLIGTKQ